MALALTRDTPPVLVWVDLMFVIGGLLSSAATVSVLAWLSIHRDVAVHYHNPWSVPMWPLIYGLLAPSGFFAVSRMLKRTPGFGAVAIMIAFGFITLVGVYYVEFQFVEMRGIGLTGVPLAAMNAFGFLITAALMTAKAMAPPSCSRCRRHLPAPTTASGYGDEPDLKVQFARVMQRLEAGNGAAGIAAVAGLSQREANDKLTIEVARRGSCQRHYYRLRLMRFVSPKWVPLPGFDTRDSGRSSDFSLRAFPARTPSTTTIRGLMS